MPEERRNVEQSKSVEAKKSISIDKIDLSGITTLEQFNNLIKEFEEQKLEFVDTNGDSSARWDRLKDTLKDSLNFESRGSGGSTLSIQMSNKLGVEPGKVTESKYATKNILSFVAPAQIAKRAELTFLEVPESSSIRALWMKENMDDLEQIGIKGRRSWRINKYSVRHSGAEEHFSIWRGDGFDCGKSEEAVRKKILDECKTSFLPFQEMLADKFIRPGETGTRNVIEASYNKYSVLAPKLDGSGLEFCLVLSVGKNGNVPFVEVGHYQPDEKDKYLYKFVGATKYHPQELARFNGFELPEEDMIEVPGQPPLKGMSNSEREKKSVALAEIDFSSVNTLVDLESYLDKLKQNDAYVIFRKGEEEPANVLGAIYEVVVSSYKRVVKLSSETQYGDLGVDPTSILSGDWDTPGLKDLLYRIYINETGKNNLKLAGHLPSLSRFHEWIIKDFQNSNVIGRRAERIYSVIQKECIAEGNEFYFVDRKLKDLGFYDKLKEDTDTHLCYSNILKKYDSGKVNFLPFQERIGRKFLLPKLNNESGFECGTIKSVGKDASNTPYVEVSYYDKDKKIEINTRKFHPQELARFNGFELPEEDMIEVPGQPPLKGLDKNEKVDIREQDAEATRWHGLTEKLEEKYKKMNLPSEMAETLLQGAKHVESNFATDTTDITKKIWLWLNLFDQMLVRYYKMGDVNQAVEAFTGANNRVEAMKKDLDEYMYYQRYFKELRFDLPRDEELYENLATWVHALPHNKNNAEGRLIEEDKNKVNRVVEMGTVILISYNSINKGAFPDGKWGGYDDVLKTYEKWKKESTLMESLEVVPIKVITPPETIPLPKVEVKKPWQDEYGIKFERALTKEEETQRQTVEKKILDAVTSEANKKYNGIVYKIYNEPARDKLKEEFVKQGLINLEIMKYRLRRYKEANLPIQE